MSITFSKHKDELLFLPLGGSGEIGMNLNLYQYKGKWLMVDCGAGFADDYLPGVDMIVPDINFVVENKDKLVGLVLTHAHEDHLGAVQYLWEEFGCPIYTTPFTASFLRAKLSEMSFSKKVPIHEINTGGKIDLDPFTIDLEPLTHSTLEMQALVIRTDLGNVLHTGDWKFDHDPLIGESADETQLKAYGDEGVLALVGDSTNVFNPGTSGSEGDLRKSLSELVAGCKNMVAVTTFASNVARIETIAKIAEENGRKVILAGRSLWRIVRSAQEAGYLKDIPEFLPDTEMKRYARDELLLLCTGCQGEPLAATAKIASGSHPTIRLTPNDTIIFSSKIIPGNDKRIYRLFNQFVKMGVEVLTEKDHFVHVSGHPARDELSRMYELVRPQIAVPVHGEASHIHEHAALAASVGVPQTVTIENGEVLRLAPGAPEKLGLVEAGYLAIDGYFLLPPNSPVMRMRRKIQRDGVMVVVLTIDKHGLATDPVISAPGCLDAQEDASLIASMAEAASDAIIEHMNTSRKKVREETIENVTRSAIRRIIRSEVGKNPVINIHIQYV